MASYRNFYINFWEDDGILYLTADETYIYFYLITHPKGSQCGIFEISFVLAESHLKMKKDKIVKAFEGLQEKGKIVFDVETREVVIINWLKYNYINSPNTKKALESSLKYIKNKSLINYLIDKQDILKGLVRGYEGVTKPSVIVNDIYIVKDSLLKPLKESTLKEPKQKKFIPPTLEEVREYCNERGNNVVPEKFIAYYDSNGWKVGSNPMKKWKSSIITWEQNEKERAKEKEEKPKNSLKDENVKQYGGTYL